MLLPLMLLLAAAGVSAQPVTINDLTCPTNNVETLEPNTNLNEHKTPGSTYLLKPGTYYIRDEIYLGDGEALCYVGTGNSREEVVVSLTGIDLSYNPFLLQKGSLGLKNLVVDGSGATGNIPINLAAAVLSATDITLKNINAAQAIGVDFATSKVAVSNAQFKA
jgi:hypothetical protein